MVLSKIIKARVVQRIVILALTILLVTPASYSQSTGTPSEGENQQSAHNCSLCCAPGVDKNGNVTQEECTIAKSSQTSCIPRTDGTELCMCESCFCGNGTLDPGENCDDGNTDDGDGCNKFCVEEYCGDTILNGASEECDNGDYNSDTTPDACREDCKNPVCGDGVKDSGESCDDGNNSNMDSCTNSCSVPVCGDGILSSGEACDDGNTVDNDQCSNSCVKAVCGDGVKQSGEQCDDGNNKNTDSCTNSCQKKRCGDGIKASNEQCDYGSRNNNKNYAPGGKYCSSSCKKVDAQKECVWIASGAIWSQRGGDGSIWDKQKRSKDLIDRYEYVPNCMRKKLSSCMNDYQKGNKKIGVSSSAGQAFRENEGIYIMGMCGGSVRSLISDSWANGFSSSSKVVDHYFDKNCKKIKNIKNRDICGFAGAAATPISLVLDNSVSLDTNKRVVKFSLDPANPDSYSIWKGSDKAPLLVYDPAKTGKVDTAKQLFGNWTFGGKTDVLAPVSSLGNTDRQAWENGYEALGLMDTNRDGEVSGSELEVLSLWFDANRDAVVDEGELRSITSEGITKLFYQDIESVEGSGDIQAKLGYERTLNGKTITGKSVDWYGETFSSKKEAVDALGAIFKNKIEDMRASFNPEVQEEVKNLEPKKVSEENLSKDISGTWIWTHQEDTEGNNPGILILEQKADNTVVGKSIVEARLEDNSEGLFSAIRSFPLTGTVEHTESGLKLTMKIQDNESGVVADSTIVISKDGLLMDGTTSQEFAAEGESTLVDYQWVAGRVS